MRYLTPGKIEATCAPPETTIQYNSLSAYSGHKVQIQAQSQQREIFTSLQMSHHLARAHIKVNQRHLLLRYRKIHVHFLNINTAEFDIMGRNSKDAEI